MLRVVLFGMPGPLAGAALTALLEAGVTLAAVAVPAPPGAPPVAPAPRSSAPARLIPLGPPPPPGLLDLAQVHGVPTLALGSVRVPAVHEALRALSPELVCVACWPWRIPPTLLAVPRLGFLNLHPAPLPELRGPAPLFWAFQQGRASTAVTLHWMDAGLDTGPIALQAPLELPVGLDWDTAEQQAADLGAALLRELLARLVAGALPRRPQGSGGSYRPAPGMADFAVDPGWPAERAFRFMRGTAAWGHAYRLPATLAAPPLSTALAYEPTGSLGTPLVVQGQTVRVQMTPGILVARC